MILVFLTFLLFHIAVSFFAPLVLQTSGMFPYQLLLAQFYLPSFLSAFANFDGAHYLRIAMWGYVNYEQVFFPLYPLFIRLTSMFFQNYLLSGLIVSYVSFTVGLVFFKKYLSLFFSKQQVLWSIVFLLLFPTSFFFISVYTEGLFFCLVVLSFYSIYKRNYKLAALFCFLSSLTRIQGVFLIVPLFVSLFQRKLGLLGSFGRFRTLVLVLSPIAGLVLYGLYLQQSFGDFLLFFRAQELFGAHRSSHQLIFLPQIVFRYAKIFLTFRFDISYFVALLEFVVFFGVLGVLIFDLIKIVQKKTARERLGLNLFSLCNILLPTFTGTLSSIPRYALLSFAFFIVLADRKSTFTKSLIATVFLAIHLLLFLLFIRSYFVS